MRLHGCHNRKEFRESFFVQNGWSEDGRRIMQEIPFRMVKTCEYDNRKIDGGCLDCKWSENENRAT